MADLFKNTAANPMFPTPVVMPAQVPTSFEMWRSDPMNLAKINQPPEAAMAPNLPAMDKTLQPQPSPLADNFIPPAAGPEPVAPQVNLGGSPAPQLNAPPAAGFDPSGIMPKRPTSPYENMGKGKFALMGLATLADNIGAALSHGTPTVGKEWLGELANTREKQQQYDQNAPKLAYDLKNQVQSDALRNAATAASTAHTTAATEQLLHPDAKSEDIKSLGEQVQKLRNSGRKDKDIFDQLLPVQSTMRGTTRQNLVDLINNTQATGPKYNIQQDKNGRPEFATDRSGNRIFPDAKGQFADPELNQQWQAIGKAHQASLNEEVDKESRVAGRAAERAAAATQNALSSADLKKGKEMASKHLESLRSAENQNELVQQLASSKSPTDQTSLAFKALGLDLPDGVHRINETELNAIRNQGGLGDKAYRAILNWQNGQQFAPEILQDIAKTASTISASKIKNANDNLDDVERVYGYKAPRGAAAASSSGSATHIVYQGGKRIGTATAEQQKKGEYTPD